VLRLHTGASGPIRTTPTFGAIFTKKFMTSARPRARPSEPTLILREGDDLIFCRSLRADADLIERVVS